MHLHHIIPRAQGGPDDIDNAIPVCLDCHAEIESRGNMGRQFSQAELREHKRCWLEVCRERPEVLVGANRASAVSGPLESLLSEMEFNAILLSGENHTTEYASPVVAQFDRAIAANALSSLEENSRTRIYRTYKLVAETSDLVRARMNQAPDGNSYNVLSNQIRDKRAELRGDLAGAIACLRSALSGDEPA